jgi:hypothetical protein
VGGSEVVDSTWLSWHHSPLSIEGSGQDRGGVAAHKRRVLQRNRKLRGRTGAKRSDSNDKPASPSPSSKQQQEGSGINSAHSGPDWASAISRRDVVYLNTDSADWTRILNMLNPHHVPDDLNNRGSQTSISGSNHSSPVYSGGTIWSLGSSSFTTTFEVPRRPMTTSVYVLLPDDPHGAFAPTSNASSVTIESASVYWLVAWARVDSHWAAKHPLSSPSEMPPQTHLANARTNPDWNYVGFNTNPASSKTASSSSVSGLRSALHGRPREVRGRLYWPSDPVVVAVKYSHVLKSDSPSALNVLSLLANHTSGQSRTSRPGSKVTSQFYSMVLPRRDILSTTIADVRVVSVAKHCAFWKRR